MKVRRDLHFNEYLLFIVYIVSSNVFIARLTETFAQLVKTYEYLSTEYSLNTKCSPVCLLVVLKRLHRAT